MTDEATPQARFALLGAPGPLMYYVCTLLRHVAIDAAIPQFQEYWPQNVADSEEVIRESEGRNFLVGAQFPSPVLVDWLQRERIPTLVVLESPLISTFQWMDLFDVGYLVAVPSITMSLSLLADTVRLPLRAVLTRSHLNVRMMHFLSHLSRFCLGQAPRDGAALCSTLSIQPDTTLGEAMYQAYPQSKGWSEKFDLDAVAQKEIAMVCDPIARQVSAGERSEICWPPSLFVDGKACKRPGQVVLELVGPARCLYYGPYLHLPRGRYEGEIAFGVSSEIRDMLIRVEVVRGEKVSEFVTRARHGGLYVLPFEFSHEDATQPVEVRMLIDRGEIEGRLGFAYVKLRPQAL